MTTQIPYSVLRELTLWELSIVAQMVLALLEQSV